MPINRPIVLAACLLLATVARAEDAPQAVPLPAMGDMIYKGVVGKALDALPMDPEERIVLQRTNAVVSGTFTVRSIAAWVGLTHPVLLIAGIAWGLYAASNIKVPEVTTYPDTNRGEPIAQSQIALLPAPPVQVATDVVRSDVARSDVAR